MIIKIIQNILIVAIIILLSVIVYSLSDFKSAGERFSLDNGKTLLKYIDGDKTVDINFLR